MRQRLATWCWYAVLFLLPWQTQWILSAVTIEKTLTPFGTLSVYVLEGLVLLALLLRGRPDLDERAGKIVQALCVLLAACFLSLTFANEYHLGLIHAGHLVVAGCLFLLMIDRRTHVSPSIAWFVGGLLTSCLLGWFQVWTAWSPASTLLGLASQHASVAGTAVIETAQGRWLRAYGSFPHPNIFGGYLSVALLGSMWLCWKGSERLRVWVWGACVILSSTLLVTFSRSAWLGLLVACLLLGFVQWRRQIFSSERFKIPVVLMAVSVLVTAVIFHHQLFARFNPSLRVEAFSAEERVSQYATVDDVFFSQPVIGVGPGSYPFALAVLKPGASVWSYQPIHNTFLLVLSELGVLGFVALFYLVVRIDQLNSSVSKTPEGLLGLAVSVCLLVIGLFDHYLWSLWPGLALSAFSLGLVVKWSMISDSRS